MDTRKELPARQSVRLRNFDYASNRTYFVTICTHKRACIFGHIADTEVALTEIGHLAYQCWLAIPTHHPFVTVDAHVVMPNHIHGIVYLSGAGAMNRAPTLGELVRTFKARATISIRREANFLGPIWQRNYHERVIRNDDELSRIRQYIADNPANWATDRENLSTSV